MDSDKPEMNRGLQLQLGVRGRGGAHWAPWLALLAELALATRN